MANSTKADRPDKPYPEYPLSVHPSGRWCKKIRGTLRYFGRWGIRKNGEVTTVDNFAEEAEKALTAYLDQKDELHAGRPPKPKSNGVTIADVCNGFLGVKDDRLQSGELSSESFRDYHEVCKLITAYFDKRTAVEHIGPADCDGFRAWLTQSHTIGGRVKKPHGTHRLAKDIRVTRMVFKYAYDSEMIDKPVRVGPNFKEPSKKSKRKSNRANGPKTFTAKELAAIIANATSPVRAMILLGINCGFGQKDVADLVNSAVDLETGWIVFPRPKTEVDRRCPLWPETVKALREAAKKRFEPKDSADSGCVFITRNRNRYVRMTPNPDPAKRSHVDSIGPAFKRIADSLGINGKRGFYSLRHTFETTGGESRDQPAVDLIMGHVDPSMAGNYRHHISDERLQAVVDVVRAWLWPEGEDTKNPG